MFRSIFLQSNANELRALIREKGIGGTSRYNKTDLIEALLRYDIAVLLSPDERTTDTESTNDKNTSQAKGKGISTTSDLASEGSKVKQFELPMPSLEMVLSTENLSDNAKEALAILGNEASSINSPSIKIHEDDIASITDLFKNIRAAASKMREDTTSAVAGFQNLSKELVRMYQGSKITLEHKSSVPLFAIFDISTEVLEFDRPESVDDQFSYDIALPVLRRTLLQYLHGCAEQIVKKDMRFPHGFTLEERSRLRKWLLKVESELDLDVPSTEKEEETKIDKRLRSIFTEDQEMQDPVVPGTKDNLLLLMKLLRKDLGLGGEIYIEKGSLGIWREE